VTGEAPVRFEATVADPPLIGRLLGAESRAYLGTIAATPIGPERPSGLAGVAPSTSRVEAPLRLGCGGYVDWYSIAPETSEADLAEVEAPERRPPQSSD
jgi:hypothetical protein